MNLEKVAIVGASGYSGEELVRLLSQHPRVQVTALTSRQAAGRILADVFPRFAGTRYASLAFIDSSVEQILGSGADFIFLALPHGVAAPLARPLIAAGRRVLDLSADFRIKDVDVYEEYYGEKAHAPELNARSVYGMPEIYRSALGEAALVACPGCYPTSVILPLAPLLREHLIDPGSIVATSLSGVSGAGRNLKTEYLFAECNESVRAYGVPRHRHLAEIEQELSRAFGGPVSISFAPHLIPITRGIHTTIHVMPASGVEPAQIDAALNSAYSHEPFIRLLGTAGAPDTKHVAQTNFLDLAWRHDPRTGRLVLFSAEDNLVKGAAGQAIQCLNVICGWPETTGLI